MDKMKILYDIEEIKQLKARYIRFGDTKNWDEQAKIFTEDFVAIFDIAPRFSKDQSGYVEISGRDNFIEAWKPVLVGVTTMHQVFLPEITITSPTTATGIWAFNDDVRLPQCHFKGWGHYHDHYLKEDGVWKIKSSRATRIHTEEVWY